MSKKKQDDEPGGDEAPAETAFCAACGEIAAEAKKLADAGMGTHDAHELAYKVWLATRAA